MMRIFKLDKKNKKKYIKKKTNFIVFMPGGK